MARLALLERSQRWNPRRLEAWQLKRLRALLSTLQERSCFYCRTLAESGLDAHKLSSLEQLKMLPLVDKARLRAVPVGQRLCAGVDPKRLVEMHTSGSTGQPFIVALSPMEKDLRVLMDLRALFAHGIGVRDRLLVFRHLDNVVGHKEGATFMGLFPRCFAPFRLPADEKILAIQKLTPDILQSHPSSLVAMAEELRGSAWRLPARLRAIISCSEYLAPSERRRIEQTFGMPVIDHYGMVEFGFVAWQCPKEPGVFHVNAEHFIVEIVDEKGEALRPGQAGEIAVTALEQSTLALVRYRTGDRGAWVEGECSCGRTLPRIRLVAGRTVDRVYQADGTEVSPHCLTIVCEGIPGIVQYQALQEEVGSIVYRYVAEPGSDTARIEQELRSRIAKEFCPKTQVRFEALKEIPPESSGKLKHIVSRVKRP